MLRGHLERRGHASLRLDPSHRLPSLRHHFPNLGLRLPLPNSHGDETRRHQNRQTGKTHDKDRGLLRTLHPASADRDIVSHLRTHVLRGLDGHLESGHVRDIQVRHALSQGCPHEEPSEVRGVHDQIPHDDDSGHHFQRLDMVGEDRAQLESVLQQNKGQARRGVRVKLNCT